MSLPSFSKNNATKIPPTKSEWHSHKSAASLKPTTKAAASVEVRDGRSASSKIRSDKKHIRDEDLRRQYSTYHVPTSNYKRYRTVWVIAVAIAVVFFILAMGSREISPSETLPFVFLFIADMSLVFAFIVNWKLIKPERKRYEQDTIKDAKSKKSSRSSK